jgi:hypothetical protein
VCVLICILARSPKCPHPKDCGREIPVRSFFFAALSFSSCALISSGSFFRNGSFELPLVALAFRLAADRAQVLA